MDQPDKLHLLRDTLISVVREAGGAMEIGALAANLEKRRLLEDLSLSDEDAFMWAVVTLEDLGLAHVSARGVLRLATAR